MDINLKKNKLLAFEGTSQKLRVSCLMGTVWLTQQAVQNDHILPPNTGFTANCKRMIVLVALTSSTVTISATTKKSNTDYDEKDFLYKIDKTIPQRCWPWRRING